jgi:hypothetical protein
MRDSIDGQIVCSGFGMHPGKIACEYLDADTGICHSAHTNRIWSGDIPSVGRTYPTPGTRIPFQVGPVGPGGPVASSSFDPFAVGCFPESPVEPLSSLVDPATIKKILDLTCEKAQLDLDRSKKRRERFSIIGNEPTEEEKAKRHERQKLFRKRDHQEDIAMSYRRMAECHELTARLYKEQGSAEQAQEELKNAIASSEDATDLYFKVLESEKELYQINEDLFVDDDVELDD